MEILPVSSSNSTTLICCVWIKYWDNKDDVWKTMQKKASSTIRLAVSPEIKYGGKKKVDDSDLIVVYSGGCEFMITKPSIGGILREENPMLVLYDATSSHVCNDGAMFKTLNGKGQFGEIKLGKKMMKIEGVNSVNSKLHDGSVKNALKVKYILGAARNILSLGVLMSCWYCYVVKYTFKVYKTDRLVIQGWKMPSNLCYLEGESVQGMTYCESNTWEKRVHFLDKDEVLGILS
ncbi:hypothetical protein Tco_0788010 [Tanacetum coccineum]